MEPTNTAHPDYYHRVVDCQWACPAHTDVPEYIRLIAQGRFTDAYMVNRHSNVFPGILGRVCDRPCEPACRRTRVEEQPVAICRLKRVAADHRDDITGRLPKIPQLKNGKRVALIGAGCASLTVANDLMPLGYEVTIFEQSAEPGGLMRTNIPSFRLPHAVLNDEIGQITGMGVDLKLNHPIKSMRELLAVGDSTRCSSAPVPPRAKSCAFRGATAAAANVHIGIAWLESVAFGHIEKIGERVLIIGVGNTAMDCCRTSLRLGARRREGDGAQAARVLQGLRLGAGGCRGGERRDRRQLLAESVRHRRRQAHGNVVRQDGIRHRRAGPDHRRAHRGRGIRAGRRRDSRHRPGERLSVDRAGPGHRIRQVGSAHGRYHDVPVDAVPGCSSAATPLSARRTSSGPWSTATRPRSPSTAIARESR